MNFIFHLPFLFLRKGLCVGLDCLELSMSAMLFLNSESYPHPPRIKGVGTPCLASCCSEMLGHEVVQADPNVSIPLLQSPQGRDWITGLYHQTCLSPLLRVLYLPSWTTLNLHSSHRTKSSVASSRPVMVVFTTPFM